MRYLLSVLVSIILFTSPLYSDDKFVLPQQKIVGLEDGAIPLGEVVILKPSEIKNPPEFFLKAIYKWKILENGKEKKRVIEQEDGEVIFGSGTVGKRLTAVLSCSYLYHDKAKSEVGIRSQVIIAEVILGPDPGPGPGPDPVPPGPTPEPTFNSELAKFAWQQVKNKVTTLSTDDKYKSSQALSKSFSSVAARIGAGTIKTVEEALEESTKSNREAVKNVNIPSESWQAFFLELKTYLYKLYESGKLTTLNDYKEAFLEVSEGLGKVSK